VILKKGDKGPEVRRLQRLLNRAITPSPNLTEDGDFGEKTYRTIVQFQKLHSLKADGVIGPHTWTALGQKISTAPSRITIPDGPGMPWMEIAIAELGIHEESLPGVHNRRIVEYHNKTSLNASTDEIPWCSSFVNWVIAKAGFRGTNNALAKSWLDWGTNLTSPRYGAVTVIKKKGASTDQATGSSTGFHVGFYINASTAHIRLLGGNQGDAVKYSSFSLNAYDVKGYRWPD
jgi:uncharacterized protein (TIGR02594 family)